MGGGVRDPTLGQCLNPPFRTPPMQSRVIHVRGRPTDMVRGTRTHHWGGSTRAGGIMDTKVSAPGQKRRKTLRGSISRQHLSTSMSIFDCRMAVAKSHRSTPRSTPRMGPHARDKSTLTISHWLPRPRSLATRVVGLTAKVALRIGWPFFTPHTPHTQIQTELTAPSRPDRKAPQTWTGRRRRHF